MFLPDLGRSSLFQRLSKLERGGSGFGEGDPSLNLSLFVVELEDLPQTTSLLKSENFSLSSSRSDELLGLRLEMDSPNGRNLCHDLLI